MADENKQNLQYFAAPSMRELYDQMQSWQVAKEKRFLSTSIHQDGGKFCCIALTNPTEVNIAGVGTFGRAQWRLNGRRVPLGRCITNRCTGAGSAGLSSARLGCFRS